MKELEAGQLSVTDHDPIRENLDRLLKDKIGEPFTQDEIIKIYKEGEERFKYQIPPGYKDQKKETENKSDVFSCSGITYQRKYGDLVLWKQIICKAKNDSVKYLIFLTDDEKEDWWWITDFQGRKKMGPRPELVDEISREAKTEFFYIYNSEQFLKYSKDYLNTQVTDESISQVREVTRESRVSLIERHEEFRRLESIAARAVFRWLNKKYSANKMIRENNIFPDYIVSDIESGKNSGFEVKFSREPRIFSIKLRDQIYRAYYEVNEGYLDELTFVFVMQDRETLDRAISIFERKIERLPSGVNLVMGIANMEIEDELEADFYPVFESAGVA
ncbi:MAG: PIN-like domain-containing protein [Snowella sp.]|nr:PIN-like domain-containing protein [Snowella sp.]